MGVRNTSGVRRTMRNGKTRWIIDITYTDRDGREQRYRRDAALQTSAGARAEADRLRLQIATHGTLEQTSTKCLTFGDFVEGDFARLFKPKYRPATRVRYEAILRQGLLEAFKSTPLDEIRAPQFRAYAAQLQGRGVQVKGPTNFLRTVLRAAVEVGKLAEMPSIPSLFKASRKLPDAPTEEEVEAMLTHARGWLRLAIALAAFAGMRLGEVRALEVRDVDLTRNQLLVRHALSEAEVVTPKSGHERPVPLVPQLAAMLDEARKSKLPRARLVLTDAGTTPSRQHVLSRLKALQTRHGLPARSFHALRHFFCSVLIRRGASVEAVRLLAGHSDLATTQRYVHAAAGDLTAAMATFR